MQKPNDEGPDSNIDTDETTSQRLKKFPNWNNWFQATYAYNCVNKGPELMKSLDLMLKNNSEIETQKVNEHQRKIGNGYEGGAVLFDPIKEKIAKYSEDDKEKTQK